MLYLNSTATFLLLPPKRRNQLTARSSCKDRLIPILREKDPFHHHAKCFAGLRETGRPAAELQVSLKAKLDWPELGKPDEIHT